MNSIKTLTLITLLTIVGSLIVLTAVDARHHGDNIGDVRHRHRHRHEVSSLTTRRNHESYKIATRKPTWNENDEDYPDDVYEIDEENKKKFDDDDDDAGDDDDDDEVDENYYRLPRNHPSRYEIRYRDTRYHVNPTRHGINLWQNIDDVKHEQQRRRNLRFITRGRRTRPWIYPPRNHDSLEIEKKNDDDIEDYDEYDRTRWHHLQDEDYDESLHRKNYPVHRRFDYSHNSQYHGGWIESKRDGKLRRSDQDTRRKSVNYRSDGRKRFTLNNNYNRQLEKNDKNNSDSWSRNKLEKLNNTVVSADDERENIWKQAELDDEQDSDDDDDDGGGDDGDVDDDEDIIDNDFFRESDPPYKTFDDIIKSLTSDDPTASRRASIKRDYRNIEIEKYLKRDAYGNLKYEPKKLQKSIVSISKEPIINTKYIMSSNDKQKLSNGITIIDNRKIDQNKFNNVRVHPMYQTKKMSLVNQDDTDDDDNEDGDDDDDDNDDDDEYLNSDDKHSDVQADVTNKYAVDEGDENEKSTSTPVIVTSITSTLKPTSTSAAPVITTTSKPVITTIQQNYVRKNSTAHSGTTISPVNNNNGVQTVQQNSSKESVKNPNAESNKSGKSAEIREALQHAIKVSREGSCQLPRARVIPVKVVYPGPSKSYIPHCAILHRCSDDTGCCRSEALTCVPKQSHKVELYFYTTSISGSSVVEKLSFYNHTECECREKYEYRMTTTTVNTSDNKLLSVQDTNEYKSYAGKHHQSAVPPQNIRRPLQKKPCRCPSEFTPRIIGGECQCNCFENDQDCIHTRRGKGYFSLRDRLCIQNDECAIPTCEFGNYIQRQGKCPRRKDQFDAVAKHPSYMDHKYRS